MSPVSAESNHRDPGGNAMSHTEKTYNILDVLGVGYTLSPMKCVFKKCGSTEVTYHQYQNDAYCATCGRWQYKHATIIERRKP